MTSKNSPIEQQAALQLARRFHEVYERLAPSFGYETRKETRAFDPTTPNGRLMVAVCAELQQPAEPLTSKPPVERFGSWVRPSDGAWQFGPRHEGAFVRYTEYERLTAERDALIHDINRHLDINTGLLAERDRLLAKLVAIDKEWHSEKIEDILAEALAPYEADTLQGVNPHSFTPRDRPKDRPETLPVDSQSGTGLNRAAVETSPRRDRCLSTLDTLDMTWYCQKEYGHPGDCEFP